MAASNPPIRSTLDAAAVFRRTLLAMLLCVCLAAAGRAQEEIDGRRVVRAVRLTESLRLDGRLDEQIYTQVVPVTGFIQTVPDPGTAATERTDVWVTFDDDRIYVSVRCWDSGGETAWIANELRRDRARDNDNVSVMLDTYGDRRDGYTFFATPLGAFGDSQITGEANPNTDFNPVWAVRTGKFDGGWTIEMGVPFKSLRYRPGASQVWGIQFRRTVRRTNEPSFFTRLPASVGTGGLISIFATSLLLSGLYLARGFGIAALSHTAYDLYLMFGVVA